jgi:hypothetical protein
MHASRDAGRAPPVLASTHSRLALPGARAPRRGRWLLPGFGALEIRPLAPPVRTAAAPSQLCASVERRASERDPQLAGHRRRARAGSTPARTAGPWAGDRQRILSEGPLGQLTAKRMTVHQPDDLGKTPATCATRMSKSPKGAGPDGPAPGRTLVLVLMGLRWEPFYGEVIRDIVDERIVEAAVAFDDGIESKCTTLGGIHVV